VILDIWRNFVQKKINIYTVLVIICFNLIYTYN